MEAYLLISALSFVLLYFAVKKISSQASQMGREEPTPAEAAGQLAPPGQLYPSFCEFIRERIEELRAQARSPDFAEELGDLGRELNHLERMSANKSKAAWEEGLFGLLQKLEAAVVAGEGEERAEALREELGREFQKLRGKK